MTDTTEAKKFVLPLKPVKALRKSPKRLIIFSPPKAGKTSIVAQLENNLIIDLENGSDFVDGIKIKANNLTELREITNAIKEAGKPYKYITLDTATKLEEMVLPLALKLYKAVPQGKNFEGDNVLTLTNGGGYLYLRQAYQMVIESVSSLAARFILLGHVKDKYVEIKGKEIEAKALDLSGKLSSIVCADADAIGFLYRKDNQTIINFVTSNSVICGARPNHLKGQEIVIAESDEKGNLKTFWDKVFVD